MDNDRIVVFEHGGDATPFVVKIDRINVGGVDDGLFIDCTDEHGMEGRTGGWMAKEDAIEMAKAILLALDPEAQIVTTEDINRFCDTQD